MKIQKFYFLFVICSFSLSAMEKSPKISFAEQPLAQAPYGLPTALWNIIIQEAVNDITRKEAAQTVHNIGLTGKYFAQRFLYNPQFNAQLVQRYAQKERAELALICPEDLTFAAAYQFNTFGARRWMRETYLTDAINFKFVSAKFLDQLKDNDKSRPKKIRKFIKDIFPKQIPVKIERRLNYILEQDKDAPGQFIHDLLRRIRQYRQPVAPQYPKQLLRAIESLDARKVESCLEKGADPDLQSLSEPGHNEYYDILPLMAAIKYTNTNLTVEL